MTKRSTKTDPELDEPLETIRQTAEHLAVSERTVWRLIGDGELPVVRIARAVRIRPEDRKTFIKRHLS